MKQLATLAGLALVAALLVSGCGGASPSQTGSTQRPTAQPTPAPTLIAQAPAGCPITPIHTEPYSGPGSGSDPKGLPWVQAEPASSGITAFLFYAIDPQHYFLHAGGRFPNGPNDKILWVIESPQATNEVEIKGTMLSHGHETFDQTFSEAVSPLGNYPSIIDVSTPGCWQFTITSGPVTGTMIVWVTDD
ncbi:MAG TPA: hypothetical protein VH599_17815 [Ktedonobacterales bacterium]|jgi:hypothetical protein